MAIHNIRTYNKRHLQHIGRHRFWWHHYRVNAPIVDHRGSVRRGIVRFNSAQAVTLAAVNLEIITAPPLGDGEMWKEITQRLYIDMWLYLFILETKIVLIRRFMLVDISTYSYHSKSGMSPIQQHIWRAVRVSSTSSWTCVHPPLPTS